MTINNQKVFKRVTHYESYANDQLRQKGRKNGFTESKDILDYILTIHMKKENIYYKQNMVMQKTEILSGHKKGDVFTQKITDHQQKNQNFQIL